MKHFATEINDEKSDMTKFLDFRKTHLEAVWIMAQRIDKENAGKLVRK